MKQIKATVATLLFASFSALVMANSNNLGLEKEGVKLANAAENVEPAFHNVPKQIESPALQYVNQPPLVPHSVAGMQVTKNVNQCLSCHSPENARVTGAKRISPTHFMDRNGNIEANTSPRRYFCLQCHVPQTNASPIVPNDFEPLPGYGK